MAEIQEIEKLSPEGGGRPPGTGPSSSQGQPPPLAPATLTANDEPIQGFYTRNNDQNDPEKAAAGAEPVQQTYDKSFWLAFWSMLIMNLAAAYEASTLAVAVPDITRDIGGTSIEAFWSGTSYLVSCTAVMLLWASLSDVFGRRLVVLATLAVFAAGCIVCALAPNFTVLIAGRTVMGIGGGGITSLTLIVLTDLVPLRDRARFYSVITMVWAIGSLTGPTIGGALAQHGLWRWIFWLPLPFTVLGFLGVSFFLKLKAVKETIPQGLRKLDYIGISLLVVCLTAFLAPVTWGGVQFPWNSWQTLVPLLLGTAGLGVFIAYEIKTSLPTLIPIRVFKDYSTSIVYAGSLIHGLVIYSLGFYIPEYFQAVKLYSPTISGVGAIPLSITIVPMAAIAGIVVGKTGHYRWAMWGGWALTTMGFGLLVLLDVNTSIPAWIFLEAVVGLGLGLLYPSITLGTQSSVPPTEAAMASTMVLFFRNFGQALGVAIGGAILQNRMQSILSGSNILALLPSGMTGDGSEAISLVALVNKLPQDSAVSIALRDAFAKSFQMIWGVLGGLAGASFLVHLTVKEYDMDQAHITEQGLARDA